MKTFRSIKRWGNVLFVIYIAGAIFFLLSIETTFNGGFDLTIRWLSAPIAIIVFGCAYFYRHEAKSRLRLWIAALILFPILVIFSWPYLVAANSICAPKHAIVFKGPIRSKTSSGGRFISCQITIQNEETGKEVTFTVPKSIWDNYAIGDEYQEKIYVGRFGIPYRWRF